MPKRIAILTGGGHISSFHAGMLGILKEAGRPQRLGEEGYEPIDEVAGLMDGYEGAKTGDCISLNSSLIESGKAGSILGSSRAKADESVKKTMDRLGIYALIAMGGNDTLGDAAELYRQGVNVVGWPKTMDNDLSKTYFCLGFPTAAEKAAARVREAHYDAITNKRIHIVTMFGRDTDWVAAAAGAWGAADLIVPAEQMYNIKDIFERAERVFEENGKEYGRKFAVVAVAEGAKLKGLESHLQKDEVDGHGHPKIEPMKLALVLKDAFKKLGEKKVAIDCISYAMRNGPPIRIDDDYAVAAGRKCIELIRQGRFGYSAVIERKETFETVEGGQRKMNHSLVVSDAPLSEVSVQRFMKPEGFMDYEKLRVTPVFVAHYETLFGKPAAKKDVVYRIMKG